VAFTATVLLPLREVPSRISRSRAARASAGRAAPVGLPPASRVRAQSSGKSGVPRCGSRERKASQLMSVPARRPVTEQVLLRHRFPRQAEQRGLGRAGAGEQGVVQAAEEGLDEAARLLRPGGDDLGRSAAEAEDAQRMVHIGRERAGDLREAPLRDQAQQHDLRAAQMAMHEAEGGGEVLVGLGGDPGDHVVVPADLDRARDGRAGGGERGEAAFYRRLAREERGAAGQDEKGCEQREARRHGRSRHGSA
jgi:hypothetical protein